MTHMVKAIARGTLAVLVALGFTLGVAVVPTPRTPPAGAAGSITIAGDYCWAGSRYFGYFRGMGSGEIRVQEAIKFWQRQLIEIGLLDADPTSLTGGFGPKTEQAVKGLQASLQVPQSGRVGRIEAAALMRPVIDRYEARDAFNIPGHRLWAAASVESCLDPAATNGHRYSSKGLDRGVCQFNTVAFPRITDVQAFDPDVALFICAANFNNRYNRFKKGANRPPRRGENYFTGLSSGPYRCSTVQCRDAANLGHYNPTYGADWARRGGSHPNGTIAAREVRYTNAIHVHRDNYPCATVFGSFALCSTS